MNYPSELTFDDFIDAAYKMAAEEYHSYFDHEVFCKGSIKLYMKNNEWCADVELYHTHRVPTQTIIFTYTARDIMNYTGSMLGF